MANKPLHIGLLAPDLSTAHGWAQAALSTVEALGRAGVQITVVAARNSPDVPGLTLHKLLPNITPMESFMPLRQWLTLRMIQPLLRDCDLIHALVEPYAPLAQWLSAGRPYVVTGHGTYVQLGQLTRWPFRPIYQRALGGAQLACVSHYTAQVAARALPGVRARVIPNGVNAGKFLALPDRRTKAHPPTVLAVGAVKARKGTLQLVRAMAKVQETLPDAQCWIMGRASGAYADQVREAIEGLGLQNSVLLKGFVTEAELLDAYSRADVFCVPSINEGSRFEGFGLVYLEASAAGLPVIGTTDTGATDAIDNGVTGLLVSQAQLETELAPALVRLLTDSALRRQMGAAGRLKAAVQTWDITAQALIDLYNDLVN
ncbi:MAG TPA: glycosyltransferase family 4 protein [Aggregatilineales bacterium]|nr:glycosyltransferase family 4 protein [Aggregatilineales bacterium]